MKMNKKKLNCIVKITIADTLKMFVNCRWWDFLAPKSYIDESLQK